MVTNSGTTTLQTLLALGLTKEDIFTLMQGQAAKVAPKHEIWNTDISKQSHIHPFFRSQAFRMIFSFFKKLFSSKKTKQRVITSADTSPGATATVTKTKKVTSVSKGWTKRLTGYGAKTAKRRPLPSFSPLRNTPTHGLPNFTVKPLANVCYINAVVQMIANIPNLKELFHSANVENSAPPIQKLKTSLLTLVTAMQSTKTKQKTINNLAVEFWRSFQAALIASPMGKICFLDMENLTTLQNF